MCRVFVSTNRSLGGQPGIKSRRIFSSDPSFSCEGAQRKKYLPISGVEDYEEIFEKQVDRLRFIGCFEIIKKSGSTPKKLVEIAALSAFGGGFIALWPPAYL